MISEKFRCLFVHVPKTAGQSIEHFFLKLHQLTWEQKDRLLLSKNSNPDLGPARLAHMRALEYYQRGHISKLAFDEYFKFSFVRNPWARLVSEYLHKKIDKRMSLKTFVLECLPQKNDFCDKYRHIIPQSDYLFDSNGNQLVNFIGRFENLQNDFHFVCQRLGIHNSILPHKNSSYSARRVLLRKARHLFSNQQRVRKHYTEYYDLELYQHVSQMYAEDIARFNFQFEARRPARLIDNHQLAS